MAPGDPDRRKCIVLAIVFGLLSALIWGAGDFAGGLSSRRLGAYRAVMFGELVGVGLLLGALAIVHEPLPPLPVWLYSMVAGTVGSLGLLVLYHAMAVGQMSIAAPVSALLAAALPVVASALIDGLPGPTQMAGFAFALVAIWLVSQSGAGVQAGRLTDLRWPLLAGLGFGVYFILTHQATQGATFWPLVASRLAGTSLVLLFMMGRRMPWRETWYVPRSAWGLVILNAVLDVGGNAFYVLAGQVGRLDIAAVLGSLYPGGTVLLAWLVLKERITRSQALGIGAALVAIVLMTMG